jgi:polyribonucleotide nucleotidyltransferase
MDTMLETIDKPRPAVGLYAPKIHIMQINPEKIKEVI